MATKEVVKFCESCERMAKAEEAIINLRGRVGKMESKLDKLLLTAILMLGGLAANFIAIITK